MIVGCKDIDFAELKHACRSEDSLLRFTLGLVPTPLRHIREVVDNQKYLLRFRFALYNLLRGRSERICVSPYCMEPE